MQPDTRLESIGKLGIGVTGTQHRRKPRHFHLAPPAFARLLEVAMMAHFFQRPFAINLFLKTSQSLFYRFAFF